MADNLRSAAKSAQGTPATDASKEEVVLGDKAVGGMDDDADHVPNVTGGLKAAVNNDNTSAKGKAEAEAKLKTLENNK